MRGSTRASSSGARFLNDRPVWGAASSNGNGEDGRIVLKKSALQRFRPSRDIGSAERGSPSSGRRLRDRDQLGELAEVLGGGSEEELVLGTIRAPQAQAVQLQDALEVGEQHLDLLPLAA